MKTQELQEKAGAKKYVSIFGKSTVDSSSPEYVLTEQITQKLIKADCGVIHGGYAGGLMQAVADTAFKTLAELNLPLERNIAIPQTQHDVAGWARVQNASFAAPAKDIYERLRDVVSHSDIALVAPMGGDGTMLELTVVWHENVIAEALQKKPVPLIILQTETGTDWRKIIETLVSELDNGTKSVEDFEWLYFASTSEDVNHLIETL